MTEKHLNKNFIRKGIEELGLSPEHAEFFEKLRIQEVRPEELIFFGELYERYLELCAKETVSSIENLIKEIFALCEIGDTELYIEDVIFNDPATIVKWGDGTKTIVKCGKYDTYDREKGLAMAIIKKLCGNSGNFNEIFKTCGCYEKEEPKDEALKTKSEPKKSVAKKAETKIK